MRAADHAAIRRPAFAHGTLDCQGANELTVKGWVSGGEPAATVEVGRSRTWLCSSGLEHLVVELEVADLQRGGSGSNGVVEAP